MDKKKLLSDYALQGIAAKTVQKAVIIFRNSRQFEELSHTDHSLVKKLLQQYDIKVMIADDLQCKRQITYCNEAGPS